MKYYALIGVTVCALGLTYVTVRDTDSMVALSLMSDTAQQQCLAQIKDAYTTVPSIDFITTEMHLDGDATTDHLIMLDSMDTCGSAGCLYEICISKGQGGGVTHIPFGYAAQDITSLNTLTNGMRDLRINDDDTLILTWDGTQYTLTGQRIIE